MSITLNLAVEYTQQLLIRGAFVICFQYYFYEFAEEGDDLHVKRPRQCLPYAVLTFSLVDPSAANQELPVVQVSYTVCTATSQRSLSLANYLLSAKPSVILVHCNSAVITF